MSQRGDWSLATSPHHRVCRSFHLLGLSHCHNGDKEDVEVSLVQIHILSKVILYILYTAYCSPTAKSCSLATGERELCKI